MSKRTRIPQTAWRNYIARLRAIDTAAAAEMLKCFEFISIADTDRIIEYAYSIATKYGEAAAALAAEMYDAIAEMSGSAIAPAVPAQTATLQETSDAVNSVIDTQNPKLVASETSKLVKTAGVDTTAQNAIRDGAEWAWVTTGDTCAFCITLASRGWQPASKKALRGNHARHIHANCDCTYMIRFDDRMNLSGYDPDKYLDMYLSASGNSSSAKTKSLRRQLYAAHKDEINAQKREAYRERMARSSQPDNVD